MTEPLAAFSAPTREWFQSVFSAPTTVQTQAWAAISGGEHALVVAPTGSGKTLAAFLWALDRLASRRPRVGPTESGSPPSAGAEALTSGVRPTESGSPPFAGTGALTSGVGPTESGSPGARNKPRPSPPGTAVVYVSPLKALGVDIERNLRAPLTGMRLAAERLGLPPADITVGVRSGDTTARERAALQRRPPDILITTPESLYLMLTSSARRTLAAVETVIVDEIHAVAGTKRGSHLALSLERLDALVGHDVQRVALSATVRPIERVARFLGGDRPVKVVAPPAEKRWDVTVRLPVPDITDPGPAPGAAVPTDPLLAGPGTDTLTVDAPSAPSLWPHVEQQVYRIVTSGRSTLVFTNARRTAERLTGRLNEIWAAEHAVDTLPELPDKPPAQVMSPSDIVRGAPAVIARAHHGSVSKEARADIEAALKSGELRCVVATSSLELGIDMGSVDRVVQIGAPPTVAGALQRIGRAGHVVGATSAGDVFPLHRGDLAPAVVATEQLLAGRIEELKVPSHPLDVLAQQTVAAAVADGDAGLDVEGWYDTLSRSMPYSNLDRSLFDSIVELLTGAYPAADFGELRARLVVGDDGRLYPRPGALRLAATSGGTIPDRGMFGVFLASEEQGARRVGELDEEMVYESRVGDVFTLGASAWRIVEITRDQVRVAPAPGRTGRLPFWHGEDEGRPAELGRRIGTLQREAVRDPARLAGGHLDDHTRVNLARYLAEQRTAVGTLPDDRTVVIERFRDELGDWRVVVHSPLGRRVLGAWALLMAESLSREAGVDVQPVASDDGVVLRLPDCEAADRLAELLVTDPDDVVDTVTGQIGGTALFAGRFRECAARALLLPRRDPGLRAPLWQQRQRAAQLLEVARHHPRFPIIIETVREVTQDVYDLPGLVDLMQGLRSGAIRLVEVTTEQPSPFAATLLFRYTGAFMYDGDAPLAERRAAMLSMDPELLAAALGTLDLRDLLDEDVVAQVIAELRHTAPDRRAATTQALADLPRLLGPIPLRTLSAHACLPDPVGAVAGLGPSVATVLLAGEPHLVAASDLGLLRDALGIPIPPGHDAPVETLGRDPLTQLVARFARTNGPFTAGDVARALGLGASTVALVLDREAGERRLKVGRFTPGVTEPEFVDPEVLRRIRARSLAAARRDVQPVSRSAFARFLADAHGVADRPPSSPDEVLLALQRLAGALLPASAWETHILPARLSGYSPAHLDALLAESEVVVRVRGSAGPHDPLVAIVPADDLPLLGPAESAASEDSLAVAAALADGDGTFASLREVLGNPPDVELAERLWRAAEEGAIAPASMAAIRARIGGGAAGAHRAARPSPRRRARLPRPAGPLLRRPGPATPPAVAGRWYRVRDPIPTPPEAAIAAASAWLERQGVVTRGGVTADGVPGGFAAAYRILSELESAGTVMRGYVVDGLGGAQFTTRDVLGQVRRFSDSPDPAEWPSGVRQPAVVVLAALDPANPYGSALPWPDHPTARPARAPGALVVLADGLCLAHVTRGGRVLTLFAEPDRRADRAQRVVAALLDALDEGRMRRLRLEEVDGERIGASGLEAAMRAAGGRLTPNGLVLEARRA